MRSAAAFLLAAVAAAWLGVPDAALGFGEPRVSAGETMPNSSRECAICHIRWVDAFERSQSRDTAPTRSGAAGMQAATEQQAGSGDMCLSCHDGSVVDSRFKVWSTRHHATDVVPPPTVSIPTDKFPLDAQGRMTCATCHTAHAVPGNSDLRTVIFLRQPNVDSSLCLACHPRHAEKSDCQHPLGRGKSPIPKVILEAGGRTSPDGHTILCQTCHEPHGAKNAWMLVLPPSELCIACHTAKAPEVSPPAGAPVHRIGHTYPGFRPPATLLQERAAFGPHGELTCLSCHRLHDASGAKPLLIRQNQDSSLCLECHEKEKGILGSPHDLRVSSPETTNAHGDKPSASGPCGACHRVHGWARDVPETNRPHSSGCMECHGPNGPGSRHRPYVEAHPVGITLPEGTSVALPVDQATKEIGCLTCHDPHAGRPTAGGQKTEGVAGEEKDATANRQPTTGNRLPTTDFQFLRQEGSQLCVLCHDKMVHALQGAHDPARFAPALRETLGVPPATGSCRLCHTAHNAQGPHLWAKAPAHSTNSPTSNLCNACHGESSVKKPQETRHPLEVSSSKSEISSGPPALQTSNFKHQVSEEVSCLSCHDVHETIPSAAMLRRPTDSLCTTCHKDQERIRSSQHDPGANRWGGPPNVLSRVGAPGKNRGFVSQGLCLDCHPMHGPKKQSPLWQSLGGPRTPESLCEACHRPGGPGPTVETPHVGKVFDFGFRISDFSLKKSADPNPQSAIRSPQSVIRCATCHEIHQNQPGSKLLRAARCDATLCVTCHATFDAVLGTPHDLRKSAPATRNARGELATESGPCGVCHLVHPAYPGAPVWAQRVPAGDHLGKGPGSQVRNAALGDPLCTCCHSPGNCAQTRVPQRVDHPEVTLLNRLSPGHPDYMPTLDEGGRPSPTGIISCPTCHQMHATPSQAVSPWRSEMPTVPTSNPPLQTPPAPLAHHVLLRTTHQTLCADCHGREALWRFLYYHQADRSPSRTPAAPAPAADGANETAAPPEF